MQSEWVIGKYLGDQAKHTTGMAENGIGYFVMDRPERGDGWIEVAFLRPLDSPIPEHLTKVTDPRLIEKLNKRRAERMA